MKIHYFKNIFLAIKSSVQGHDFFIVTVVTISNIAVRRVQGLLYIFLTIYFVFIRNSIVFLSIESIMCYKYSEVQYVFPIEKHDHLRAHQSSLLDGYLY